MAPHCISGMFSRPAQFSCQISVPVYYDANCLDQTHLADISFNHIYLCDKFERNLEQSGSFHGRDLLVFLDVSSFCSPGTLTNLSWQLAEPRSNIWYREAKKHISSTLTPMLTKTPFSSQLRAETSRHGTNTNAFFLNAWWPLTSDKQEVKCLHFYDTSLKSNASKTMGHQIVPLYAAISNL